jgi:anthranilate synthase component 1
LDFERFRSLAIRGGLVPLWRDVLLDTDTPVTAFHKLKREPFSFLLESAPAGGETWSRYTFMGTEPRSAWKLTDGEVEIWSPGIGWRSE